MGMIQKATIVLGLVTMEANGESLVLKHQSSFDLGNYGMEQHSTPQESVEVDATGNVLGLATMYANEDTLVRKHQRLFDLGTDDMEHYSTQQKSTEVDATGNVESSEHSVDSAHQPLQRLVRNSMEVHASGNVQSLDHSPSLVRKSMTGVMYQFSTLPMGCQRFATKCGRGPAFMESLSSWADAAAAFETCCLAGGHKEGTCKWVAWETFGNRTSAFSIHDSLCSELESLSDSHDAWNRDHMESGLVEVDWHQRATAIAVRLEELRPQAPQWVTLFFGGLALTAGLAHQVAVGQSLTQMGLASIVLALSTHLQKCGGCYQHFDYYIQNGCEDFKRATAAQKST